MKFIKTFLILIGFSISAGLNAQSCCSMNAPESFALFAGNKQFVSSHDEPLPFSFTDQKGKMISYKTADSLKANAYEIKAAQPSSKYVFVIHEWWGLNDYIKQEADKICAELGDVNVIALDLYDGKVASTKDSASKYMGAVKTSRAQHIINGAIAYAGKKTSIATIGWCFGGGWSLQASLLAGKQAKACVMYYGMPEKDKAKLKKENAKVLGIFAGKDGWITKEVVNEFEKNMKELNKSITIRTYDADHAFANPSNPHYAKEFAEDAHGMAMKFIRENLK
jgi:carboxymethylenebutenolidase